MPRVKAHVRNLAALLFAVTASAWAQQQPPKLEPLPEPPPPPPGMELDAEQEPQVTILKKGEDTVEEFRVNGQQRDPMEIAQASEAGTPIPAAARPEFARVAGLMRTQWTAAQTIEQASAN